MRDDPSQQPVVRMVVLADHGQFYAFDASLDPCDPLPEITDETARRGWVRNAHAIHYFTVGEYWSFRLDVFVGSAAPELGAGERVLCHTLHLPSGELAVGNPIAVPNLAKVALAPGVYALHLRAFNLGVESKEELTDLEVLRRGDLERYELFVLPGPASEEGVVLGRARLW